MSAPQIVNLVLSGLAIVVCVIAIATTYRIIRRVERRR